VRPDGVGLNQEAGEVVVVAVVLGDRFGPGRAQRGDRVVRAAIAEGRAEQVESAVALGVGERMVTAQHQHLGREADPRGDRVQVAEGRQRVPVGAPR